MSKKILSLLASLLWSVSCLIAQPVINISSASANNGEPVAINVTLNGYTNYVTLEFHLIWDPNVIRFQNLSNVTSALPGFDAGTHTNVQQGNPANSDTLVVTWFENNANPVTVPNGTVLFTINYVVTGDPCDVTGLTIPSIEIADENDEVVNTTVNPGSVSVPGTGCGTFDGVRIIGEMKTVNSGSPVCIKFTSEGFTDIAVASYVITFDPSVIQYTGIQNINWPDLVQGSTYSDADAGNGIIRVVWTDPNAGTITLPDGTLLYELCFNAVGSGGQMSLIDFASVPPTPIEFADGNSNILDFQGVPGKVTVEGVLEGFALILEDTQAIPGSEVCISMTVNDFIDIIAIQTSINWDSTKLEFVRFEGFNLPGLTESVAGPEAPGNNAGQAVIAWNDPQLQGITLTNGTEILRICFNVLGACDETTEVIFSPLPSEIEFADINDEITIYTLLNSTVDLSCDACAATIVNVLDICDGGEVGGIDISVTGACATPVTYLWSNNETTQDLNGIPAGDYVVTITIGGNMFIILDTITVRVLDPIQVSANITDDSGAGDGSIDITVTGGEPGYTYIWSSGGVMTQDIGNLSPGQYSVTITDANGCTFIGGPFTVNDANAISAIVTPVCIGTNTGEISITVVNCVAPPHTYIWAPGGQTTATISNLTAGTYTVTVTGSGGSTCTASFEVVQASSVINVEIDTMNETSAGNDGAIDLTVTGGQPPYTFQWSDGPATTEDRTGLTTGNYQVTITDVIGCEVTITILIRGMALFVDLAGSSYNGVGVSCAGECDGEVLALPGNGIGNMTYRWNTGATTQVISNVCAGTYTVTVTDELQQTATASFTLIEPPELILQLQTNCASAPGTPDGSAFAQLSGGVQPYNFIWSNGGTTSSIQNVAFGTYLLIASDDNGCQKMQRFDICIDGVDCYQAITVITPNGDGKNDRFVISCVHDYPNVLSIYNRYGGLEFEMDNYDNSWEGTDAEGNELSDGGYHWVLQVFLPNGDRQIYKETVSLVRSLD